MAASPEEKNKQARLALKKASVRDVEHGLRKAVVETLAVGRRKLTERDLALFAVLRFRRAFLGPHLASWSSLPSDKELARAARIVRALAAEGAVVIVVGKAGKKTYALGGGAKHAKAKPARKIASKKKGTPALSRTRCYFLSTQPFEKVSARLRKRFEVFDDLASSIGFRWRHAFGAGPDFRLEPSDVASLARQAKGPSARAVDGFVAVFVLTFDDLDAVLDEANGLIEAQATIQAVTRGPRFNAWNKVWSD